MNGTDGPCVGSCCESTSIPSMNLPDAPYVGSCCESKNSISTGALNDSGRRAELLVRACRRQERRCAQRLGKRGRAGQKKRSLISDEHARP